MNVTIGPITHTRDEDLDIYMWHPDNRTGAVERDADNWRHSDNYVNSFDDEALTSINGRAGAPLPARTTWRVSLAATLTASLVSGTWQLRLYDVTQRRHRHLFM